MFQAVPQFRFACALRLCMLVALWNGPFPWVHVHGSLDGTGSSALASHLVRFHASDVGAQGRSFGWHLHFILPWAALEDGPCPANGSPRDFRDVVAAPCYGGLSYDRFAVGGCVEAMAAFGQPAPAVDRIVTTDVPASPMAPSSGPPAHFLQTFLVSFVGDLIGVSRC